MLKDSPAAPAQPDYRRSPVPRYLQIAGVIRRRIEDGVWGPNEKISTLQELEAEFQVARVTVRQAVEVLQGEGLVRRIQGKGTFVSASVEDKRWLKLDLKWHSLAGTIGANIPRFLPVATPPAPPTIRPEDGTPAARYRYLESVQSRRGQPYSFARVHFDDALYALAPARFDREPTVSVIASLDGLTVKRARQSFIVGTVEPRVANLLATGIGFPTVEAHLVITDENDVVIYVADIVYRGDCVQLDIDLLG
ncbi:GntR family transcriptional regulator [Ancylobacter dichloromethanicus]|uniref:GntR family transcriptional regulator n=1 Tax=Ancylobacter dichloromethanicus TaxID=518825 RepID=A0A9W6JE54_9HYPH|nr:GntR family transcriptional regulator [Ancylobacter dichloromethanicus]MBS7552194.1 GntR family transcriptional regulator [Ancylobacter dichloromethanicus]GLK73928.1 GntR family transcriptional regulator [Ancylobacter dichloromethanicus]